MSRAELEKVFVKYDWVINARRSLLGVKVDKPLEEFKRIVAKVSEA